MADESIFAALAAHAWKYTPRLWPVTLIVIHSTRGPTSMALQYQATKNWFISPQNRTGDYAAISSYAVGDVGQLCEVMPDDYYPTYSAGHMDPLAISYEVAQPDDDTPFTEASLDRLAREVAGKCRKYGIPPTILPWVSADNHEAPGIARHDRSDNGRRWGKSDPGKMFDDRVFERRVQAYLEEEDMVFSAEEFEALKRRVARLESILRTIGMAGLDRVRVEVREDLQDWLVTHDENGVAIEKGRAFE